MEIEIPEGGCFVASGYHIYDHYLNNQRTRYYLGDGNLVRGSTSTYSNLPTGSYCLSKGEVLYHPEIMVYFMFIACCIVASALVLLFKVIFKMLWSSR